MGEGRGKERSSVPSSSLLFPIRTTSRTASPKKAVVNHFARLFGAEGANWLAEEAARALLPAATVRILRSSFFSHRCLPVLFSPCSSPSRRWAVCTASRDPSHDFSQNCCSTMSQMPATNESRYKTPPAQRPDPHRDPPPPPQRPSRRSTLH